MCTLILLRRAAGAWPLILAANRDEMLDRPWLPPARHWPDRPEVVAGQDVQAGGSWLGINDHGVVAGILNREGSLGAAADKRSRGELVLEALDHADAAAAAKALAAVNGAAYRSFNLVIADNRDAYWLCNRGGAGGVVEAGAMAPGLTMMTAGDANDVRVPRVRAYLPRFRAAPAPDPATPDWRAWETLMASRAYDAADGPQGAMTMVTESGFGTVSGSLIALPAEGTPVWRFASGPPGEAPYRAVTL